MPNTTPNLKVALVTGGSSGIGLAVCRELARRGYRVYELSRRVSDEPHVTHLTADVTDDVSVSAAVAEIVARENRLDLAVCNAGFGISGAVETTAIADAKRQFDVNYFGAVNTITAALPHLRAACGRIIVVSSVAAALPVPFQAHYSAAKAALNALVSALRGETAAHGITVAAVMPGDTATGFTDARRKSDDDGVYAATVQRSLARMERDERRGASPESVAKVVANVAERRRVRPFYAVGLAYKAFCVIAKVLPSALVGWIERKLYT
ncbi:MAG: SDR family NAD(P)-dependent oxidoreductase [Oscillospiraceae bacterium]|jgi:NAD(P)-dependent dehydrogenase (short-subunit alcohol dehydrogenase family)|nr:SDR family NAD(P)-dependent oxidoreductase [Oscillospiraceae bacterium]